MFCIFVNMVMDAFLVCLAWIQGLFLYHILIVVVCFFSICMVVTSIPNFLFIILA